MPVNIGLAQLSDHLLLSTVVLYALAMLAHAGDFAYGRRAARAEPQAQQQPAEAPAPVAVPAAVAARDAVAARAGEGTAAAAPGSGEAGTGHAGPAPASPGAGPGTWVRAAVALTAIGLVTHGLGILTRGMAEHRIPWGNMYEFVTAITFAAVLAFLVVVTRYRAYSVGLFVMAPVVLGLGLCATVLYTAAGPLVPALHSYWIAIHVTAAILASGSFIVAAVMTVIYLIADRYSRRAGADQDAGFGAVLRRLPATGTLDRLSYRTVVFAFPIWTFAIIAGAIWADQAWGRYWGWDPKETWAFITWVVYAGYLHARATAGWRGRKAACIQLAGFACLMFNLVGVNLWITGLHSYAGVG